MSQQYRYVTRGLDNDFDIDLGTEVVRLGSIAGWTMKAQHCQVGSSSVTFDDPDADVGHDGDAILGLQFFDVYELDSPTDHQLITRQLIGARDYGRRPGSSLITGVAREIVTQLNDVNSLLSLQAIPRSDTTANRPAETVGDRLTWILGSTYLDGIVGDAGLVTYPSATMTAADYRTQRPVNVVNDCELAGRFYAFVYLDETADPMASLFFDNANTSTAFPSHMFLTNDLSVVDNLTVFAVEKDVRLRRDPVDVGDEAFLQYKKGIRARTLSSTADLYGHKTLIAPNSNVRTSAKADDEADDFLAEHATEEDTITGTVKIPSSRIGLIQAGMRIGVLFTHLPGYTDWAWARITQWSPGQREETDQLYTVPFELSPQEPIPGPSPAPHPAECSATYFTGGTWTQTAEDHYADFGPIQSTWNVVAGGTTVTAQQHAEPFLGQDSGTQPDQTRANVGTVSYELSPIGTFDPDEFRLRGYIGARHILDYPAAPTVGSAQIIQNSNITVKLGTGSFDLVGIKMAQHRQVSTLDGVTWLPLIEDLGATLYYPGASLVAPVPGQDTNFTIDRSISRGTTQLYTGTILAAEVATTTPWTETDPIILTVDSVALIETISIPSLAESDTYDFVTGLMICETP